MTRDNLLFLVIGALVGFVAGYLLEEQMAEIQPPMRVHGAMASSGPAAAPGAPGGAATGPLTNVQGGAPGGGAPGGGAPMAQIQDLRRRVDQDPQDAEAARELGNANFDIGNWQQAAELYERYLEIEGEDPDALIDLGLAHRAMGDMEAAVESLDRALAADPDHWLAHFNKAIVLGIDVGDLDAAEREVEALRALRPEAPELERLIAELKRRRGAS